MIKTAVVILNWNGREMLEKFLRDVCYKTISSENAVYIVDNGSTDNSLEWVKTNLPDIGTISFEDNLGFAGGYCRAMKMIEAEYYVLLNSDIEVTENWIAPVISYMDNNPDVAACQPKILSYSDRGSFEYAGAAGGFIDKYGFPFCRGRVYDVVEKDEGQYDDLRDIFWASGACMFVRSTAWHETGGLDPDFFVHMEEIDLCWRIHKRGYRIAYIPGSVIYHVGGGTLPYESPAKLFYNFRNNLFLLHKNLPGRNYRKIIFMRMTMDGLGAIRYLIMFRFRSFCQILSAHLAYHHHKKGLEIKRRAIISGPNHSPDNLILNKSMAIAFFLKGQKIFTELWPENN